MITKKQCFTNTLNLVFPGGSAGKESTCNAGDLGSIPGLGRYPGEGKGYPLQYSGLENSMDCVVYGVTESQTLLNDFHSLNNLESRSLSNMSQQAVLSFILKDPPDVRKRKCPIPHPLTHAHSHTDTPTLTLSPSALGSHHAWGVGSVRRPVRAP